MCFQFGVKLFNLSLGLWVVEVLMKMLLIWLEVFKFAVGLVPSCLVEVLAWL